MAIWFTERFNLLAAYLETGGYVIIPLSVLALALWFLLGLRIIQLKQAKHKTVKLIIERCKASPEQKAKDILSITACNNFKALAAYGTIPMQIIQKNYLDGIMNLARHSKGVRVITSIAPLLGLLGTVHGMIETFDSMQAMALFSQSGGIAGGISEALITTQIGLVIAIPGLFIGRLLDAREERLRNKLERMKDILIQRYHAVQEEAYE